MIPSLGVRIQALMAPGPSVIKPFTVAIYEFLKQAKLFVPGKLFQHSTLEQKFVNYGQKSFITSENCKE